MGLNKILLLGKLGQDPRPMTFEEDTTACILRMATNTFHAGKEYTHWHDVFCYGKLAEQCLQFLKKGSGVFVEGQLRYKSLENGGGAFIVAHMVEFTS